LQCVVVCCSVLQCVAVCCSVLQWHNCADIQYAEVHGSVAVCGSVLQCVAVCCSLLQFVAVRCSYITVQTFNILQCIVVYRSVLQCVAVCCSVCQCFYRYPKYGVATISRLLKIIGLFCRISSLLQGSFTKETYNFKEPTNRSHPIVPTDQYIPSTNKHEQTWTHL